MAEVEQIPLADGPPFHPLQALQRAYSSLKKTEKDLFNFEPYHQSFVSFIDEISQEEFCVDVSNPGRPKRCSCMKDVNLEQAEKMRVAVYLCSFAIQDASHRQ